MFRFYERVAFVAFFAWTSATYFIALTSKLTGAENTSKWMAMAGLLATATGIIQLEVSGLFDELIAEFVDEKKYPYGPPSNITRQIIDNPDRPFYSWLRNIAIFSRRTGFWFIIVGTLTQVVAVWV
jgi:hypothetical protein